MKKKKKKKKKQLHSITCHEGPDGEYTYSSTLSLTSALDGGGWLSPHLGRFTPGNDLRWVSGPV
jgi:hypothetical protein